MRHDFTFHTVLLELLSVICLTFGVFLKQFIDEQENVEALPGETVTIITELPEAGLEVTWLKDNVPLSLTDEKYETVNKDTSYELIIPDVTGEDAGEYKVQGGGFESKISLTVTGKWVLNCKLLTRR